MEKRRKIPIGIQSFSQMIKDNYIYVDKTKFIWELVDRGYAYLLSRPRCFGKSLLVSTMREYFEGNKELFKGLYIYDKETEWKKYPVFHFDFSGESYDNENSLKNKLSYILSGYEKKYGCDRGDKDLSFRFQALLKTAYEKTGLRCVVLVDEYDTSFLETLDNPELNKKYRRTFMAFFEVIKGYGEYIKFAFFIGITKLRCDAVLGGVNNLNDISKSERYSGICGITQEELEKYFAPEIEAMARERDISKADCLLKIKKMYDGYSFAKDLKNVYNPFSLVKALDSKNTWSYWVNQTTSTFLIDRIKKNNWDIIGYDEGYLVKEDSLGEIEMNPHSPKPIFYQGGYLTIKEYYSEDRFFLISYPNEEIRIGLTYFIIPAYLDMMQDKMTRIVIDITIALEKCDLETFFDGLKSVYDALPCYEGTLDKDKILERDFKNVLSIVFILVGKYITREAHFSRNQSHCIMQNSDYIYIFEFKRDKSAKEALAQIDEKGYADAFKEDKRKIVKLGVNFSSEARNITEWEIGRDTATE